MLVNIVEAMLFAIVFGLFGVSLAVPALDHGALKGYCRTDRHCKRNECCVSFNTPRGKRAPRFSPPGLRKFLTGQCQERGSENSRCFVDPLQPSTNSWYVHCPCEDGLYCAGDGTWSIPIGELGYCTIQEKECFTSNDCSRSECCVSKVRPIGKRSADSVNAPGTCKPMGTRGSSCFVRQGSGRPEDLVFQHCPCKSGLICEGTGIFDIPLGEVGECGLPTPDPK